MKSLRLDVNGSDNKPFPQEENFSTIGNGYPMGGNIQPGETNPAEVNSHQSVNGSTDKPFPQERNFTQDVASTQPIGMGEYTPSADNPDIRLGQIKYARREGAPSIYKDGSRETANDITASTKAESSCVGDVNMSGYDEAAEESQGI